MEIKNIILKVNYIELVDQLLNMLMDYKAYYFEGKRHRTDGPAIEYANGDKAYYFEGKRHRTDGPAAEYTNGGKEYYFEGKKVKPFSIKKLNFYFFNNHGSNYD
jgi:hypothetical protein